jgi:hypothetical protein
MSTYVYYTVDPFEEEVCHEMFAFSFLVAMF